MTIADIFLGIDLGTSSVRCTAINSDEEQLAVTKVDLPQPENTDNGCYDQDPSLWWDATVDCLAKLGKEIPLNQVKAIAIDGTSSTVLLTDEDSRPISTALMYNDTRSATLIDLVDDILPTDHLTRSASSSLLKSLWLLNHKPSEPSYIRHQADWIVSKLTGINAVSDENNCLKLGYDSIHRCWPGWMKKLPFDFHKKLPKVSQSGDIVGNLCPSVREQTGISMDALVLFGTTDSTASTLATGIDQAGQAVTTLGTTMVMKTLTQKPVNNFQYGLYSHRLASNLWLAGGASNAGGNVLLKYFPIEAIDMLSKRINPDQPSGLNYYPLTSPGERFPINDPKLQPRLEPRPASDVLFLTAIFEGLANIEKLAYEKITELGGTPPQEIITSGGKAAHNEAFTAIRQRILGIPIRIALHTEASYGAALIAKRGWNNQKKAG